MNVARKLRRVTAPLALAGLAACGAGGAEVPIHIGLAGPVNQPNGRSMHLAAQMAIDEINLEGGINGRPLALVVKDDEANQEKASPWRRVGTTPRRRRVSGTSTPSPPAPPRAVTLTGFRRPEISGGVGRSGAGGSPARRPSRIGCTTASAAPAQPSCTPTTPTVGASSMSSPRRSSGPAERSPGPFLPDHRLDRRGSLPRARDPQMDAHLIAPRRSRRSRSALAARRLDYRGPILGDSVKPRGGFDRRRRLVDLRLPPRPTEGRAASWTPSALRRRHRGAMTYAIRLLARCSVSMPPALSAQPFIREITVRRAIRYLAGVEPYRVRRSIGTIRFDEKGDVDRTWPSGSSQQPVQFVTAFRGYGISWRKHEAAWQPAPPLPPTRSAGWVRIGAQAAQHLARVPVLSCDCGNRSTVPGPRLYASAPTGRCRFTCR